VKKIFVLLFCILLFARYGHCDVAKDALFDVIQARFEKTVDADFRRLNYWKELIVTTPNDQPETTVSKIMEEYLSTPAAKDTALNGLTKLVPEAVGPVALMISASDAEHRNTGTMTDLSKDKRLNEFIDTVIKPSSTLQDLKKHYDTYKSTAAIFTAVPGAERQELEKKMDEIVGLQSAAIVRKEKVAAARQLSELTINRGLKKIRSDTQFRVLAAQEYLSAAGKVLTSVAIQRFVSDAPYAESIKVRARQALSKRNEAAIKPGDLLLGKALQLESAAELLEAPTVDYAPFIALDKDAADKLTANAIPGDIYIDAENLVSRGAGIAHVQALTKCTSSTTLSACNDAYNRFVEDSKAIRQNVDERASAVKAELEKNTYSNSKEWTPTETYAKLNTNFNALFSKAKETAGSLADAAQNEKQPSYAYEIKRGGGAKQPLQPLPLQEFKTRYQQYSMAVSSYSAMITDAERCANLLKGKIQAYEPDFKKRYDGYYAVYSANAALAEYAGITFYTFQKEIDDLSGAQEMLSEGAGSFVEETYINGLKSNQVRVAKEADSWKSQLNLNELFVSGNAGLPQMTVSTVSIKGIDKITAENFQSYYDKNLRGFIMDDLQGALILLSEIPRETDPAEQVRFGTATAKAADFAGTRAFTSLVEHEKRLKDFQDKISAIKEMGLEDRAAPLLAASGKAQKEYDAIALKSAEAQKIWNDTEQFRAVTAALGGAVRTPELPHLYSGAERTLSVKILQPLADQYAAAITKAYETEKRMAETFKKYQAAPLDPGEAKRPQDYVDAMTAIGARKWDYSQAVWAEYGRLSKINADVLLAENRKINPVKSLTVNGRVVDGSCQQSVEFLPSDLRDGSIIIEGQIFPEAVKHLGALRLSLDGGTTKAISLPVAESFSYRFKPQDGTAYSIKVMPELVSKDKAGTFPGADKAFNFVYVEGNRGDIVNMYALIKAAYEVKNDTAVLSFLDDGWKAGDGTTVAILKENIAKTFREVDNLKFDTFNMKMRHLSTATCEVSYDLVLVSRIINENLKHEYKSPVVDEVSIGANGKPRIMRTISGRFWYSK
jgi:hypothetical protein